MSDLLPRDPVTEWVQQAAVGKVRPEKLTWVNPELTAPQDYHQNEKGFSHPDWHHRLPPAMLQAAAETQADGVPTLLEGLLYLMAWMDWSVEARDYLWSPLGWQPELLAQLAEAYGVDPAVHGGDPERLARLVARLGRWFPLRGHLDRSLELLKEVRGHALENRYEDHRSLPDANDAPLQQEVLACHDDHWWAQRGNAPHHLRIQNGWLRFQPTENGYPLSPEDVLAVLHPDTAPNEALLRLLPAGACIRVVPLEKS